MSRVYLKKGHFKSSMLSQEIPIIKSVKTPYVFPVKKKKLREALSLVEDDLAGIKGIEIITPSRNCEFGYFGRYIPEQAIINLYAHVKISGVYIIGRKEEFEWGSTELRKKILEDTIFHEIGHHLGFIRYNDLSEEFAENYAKSITSRIKFN